MSFSTAGYNALRLGDGVATSDQAPRWLLLHGFTGSCQDWSGWPRGTPAIAIDLPGHGRSPDPVGGFEIEVRRLLDALPGEIDCLAGYSLGGRIVLGLIRVAPERFRRAVVISAHLGLADPSERRERRRQDGGWAGLLREQGIVAFVDAWERQPLFAAQAALAVDVVLRQRRCRLSHRPEGLAQALESFGLGDMPEMSGAVSRWPGELDWIVGERDQKFSAIARELRRLRGGTRLHLIPGVGHNPLLEAPAALYGSIGLHHPSARRSARAPSTE
jgi:2-succinyl-6-hydroxy-2,4-cyclohexadiene-1-carboxylate synthase